MFGKKKKATPNSLPTEEGGKLPTPNLTRSSQPSTPAPMEEQESSNFDDFLKVTDTISPVIGDSKVQELAQKGAQYAVSVAKSGVEAADKLTGVQLVEIVTSNPALQQMIHIADQLVEIGKVVPFVAPAFAIIKVIIDIEKQASEADAKCTDLLERINFMVSHLTILENVRLLKATKSVMQRIQTALKDSASLIATYRKQGAIARRFHMTNKDKFNASATAIQACCADLALSLQIGSMEILSRAVPVDPEDEIAQKFIEQNGGADQIRRNPDKVKRFAKMINQPVDDSVMGELNTNITELMHQNQVAIEQLLKNNVTAAVVDGIKDLAAQINELEMEGKLQCVQCGREYRNSVNGPTSCSFHAGESDESSYSIVYDCCGQTEPCQYRSHRFRHHCDYPYGNFFRRARSILPYVNEWMRSEDTDMDIKERQEAMVGQVSRWPSDGTTQSESIIVQVGSLVRTKPYFLDTFGSEELDSINRKDISSDKSLIFRTSLDESAFSMAEWGLDPNGIIVGIKLTTKVATSDGPTVHYVPIDSATCVKAGDVQTLSKGGIKIYKPIGQYTLSETVRVGAPLLSKPIREPRTDFQTNSNQSIPILLLVTSSPPLQANPEGVPPYLSDNADNFIGSISVLNKAAPNSALVITIISATASFRLIGDTVYAPVKVFELVDTKLPMTIGPRESFELKFKAIIPRTEADSKLRIRWWNRAAVARKRPLRLKLTLTDIDGKDCSLVLEYVFNPFRIELPEMNDLGFFYVDDHEFYSRYSIRMAKGSKVIEINHTEYGPGDLAELVYIARKSGETEISMKSDILAQELSPAAWKVYALVDISCQRVYAFKVLLAWPGEGVDKKTAACMGYVLCPDYGEATESRPVQYAVEKAEFPMLESVAAEAVLEDDLIDEWVPEPERPQTNVSMNGVSGGTLPMTEALVEKLASIDKNLARAATAAENIDKSLAKSAKAIENLVSVLEKMFEKESKAESQVVV